jgi:hypothetical protein
VFKDSNNDKAQMYAFAPAYYYKWNGTISENGSALVTASLGTDGTGRVTYKQIVEFGNALIDSIMNNEDLGIMSGDTLKAFGTDGIRQLKMIDDKYLTIPFYDEGMLAQIHNLTIAPSPTVDDDSIIISQTTEGTIVQDFKFTDITPDNLVTLPFLDSGMENPTPEYTMEATRLMSFYEVKDSKVRLVTSGTEIVTAVTVYGLDTDGEVIVNGLPEARPLIDLTEGANIEALISNGTTWTKFDWAPSLYIRSGSDLFHFGDLFNYTVVDSVVVGRIHDTALQSLFNTIGLNSVRSK